MYARTNLGTKQSGNRLPLDRLAEFVLEATATAVPCATSFGSSAIYSSSCSSHPCSICSSAVCAGRWSVCSACCGFSMVGMPFPASASLHFSSSPGVPATALKAYPSPPASPPPPPPAPHLPDDARAQHLAVEGATNRLVLSAKRRGSLGRSCHDGLDGTRTVAPHLARQSVFSLSLVLRICLSRHAHDAGHKVLGASVVAAWRSAATGGLCAHSATDCGPWLRALCRVAQTFSGIHSLYHRGQIAPIGSSLLFPDTPSRENFRGYI